MPLISVKERVYHSQSVSLTQYLKCFLELDQEEEESWCPSLQIYRITALFVF